MREQIIFCIAGMFSFFLRDQLSDTFDLLTEIPRGPEDTALTSDNELDHAVGGSDCGAVSSADADRDLFLDLLHTAGDLVGIEDDDDTYFPESLVVA